MGGDYEKTLQAEQGDKGGQVLIQQPPAAPGPVPPPSQRRALRRHLSGGEVHFHDDAANLKAAVPVAEYHIAERSVNAMQPWQYLDRKNKSLLTIQPYREGDTVECYVRLDPIQVGQTLEAIFKFG